MIKYQEHKPLGYLAKYIERYWSAYSENSLLLDRENLNPDGTIELIFNFGGCHTQIYESAKKNFNGSFVIGVRKQSLYFSHTDKLDLFSVRFRAGGFYPFFKIPVHSFANGFYALQDLFGNEFSELESRLYEAKNMQTRVQLVEDCLLRRLNHNIEEYSFVERFSKEILNQGSVNLYKLIPQFNTSYKTLERKFRNVMGLTPSELARITRFNKALLLMYSLKARSLTEVAYDSGYYDQSQFNKEFKNLTGYSPARFIKEQFTIIRKLQPALAERLTKSYNF